MSDTRTDDTTIDYSQPRLSPELLDRLLLKGGGHNRRSDGLCVMEAVAWFAGEPHSARPACSCPVIAAYAMRTNDSLGQAYRDELVKRIPRIAGSKSTPEVMMKRRDEICFRGVSIMLPILFEALGDKKFPDNETRTWNAQLRAAAAELRQVKREDGIESWRAAAQRARAISSSADASASASADAYADAYADASASASADADAYASAYASAYVDAEKVKAEIRTHALATLDAILDIRG